MTDLAPGTQLGGYRIATVLGRGGMGVVYLAQQLALDRRVALKVIDPGLSEDPEFRERFSREAQLAAAIDHRSIIPVYDAGEADGRLYLSMRYVKGLDLRTVLQLEGPLDPDRALDIAGAVAEALDAAHAAGLVHRDVKPANILIEDGPGPESERVFLTDFGLTKRVSSSGSGGLTRVGIFVGTPAYASPEQCSGKPVDGRTDEYSLACVLHECLTGATPFPRDSDAQVLAAHLLEHATPVSTMRPGIPRALDDAIARGMAKDPAARFGTCTELVDASRSGLHDNVAGTVVAPPPWPGGAPPAGAAGVPGSFAASTGLPPPGVLAPPTGGGTEPATLVGHRRDDDHPRRSRRTWLLVALIALAVVGGVVAVVLATTGGPTPTPPTGPASATGPTSGTSPTTPPSGSPGTSPPSPTAPATTTAVPAALTDYVGGVDDLLAESSAFRARLVAAVVDAGSAHPKAPQDDIATVRQVVAERRSALQRVTTWAVPPEASLANDLLATAFRDAIVDDENYDLLVKADIAHDDATAKRVLDELQSHRDAATDPDKDAFVRAYDALRGRAGLPPLPPGFSF
jgi:Protein kinase domain